MTIKQQYEKDYRDLEAFLQLACYASSRSFDLCKRLLNACCASAIEYGRVTKNVQQDLIEASTPSLDFENNS